jgi:2'-5' RNA ligase
LRLFVAVLLPTEWRDHLAARGREIERLAPGYTRWVAPELMHLTVVFLGEQPAERVADIDEALNAATSGQRPFRLSLGHLGHFGGSAPRVLWVEARAPGARLAALRSALDAALDARGIAFDRKPLIPHLTLGRARRDAPTGAGRLLPQRLRALSPPSPPHPFEVRSIALVRSQLSPRGPHYMPLSEHRLSGRGPEKSGSVV